MFVEINSRENENLKFVSKLLKSAKLRSEERQFVIEGFKVCYDTLECGITFLKCFCSKKFFNDVIAPNDRDKLEMILRFSQETFLIDDKLLSLISNVVTPQGIVCVCQKSANNHVSAISDKFEKVVILDRVQNPDNLGSILRSCCSFGVDLVILTNGCCDIYNPKVLRSSSSGVFKLKFFERKNLIDIIDVLHELAFQVFALVVSDDSISLEKVVKSRKMAMLFGNEGQGLCEKEIKKCDKMVKIPMNGGFESLNVSVAAGIVLYKLFNFP